MRAKAREHRQNASGASPWSEIRRIGNLRNAICKDFIKRLGEKWQGGKKTTERSKI